MISRQGSNHATTQANKISMQVWCPLFTKPHTRAPPFQPPTQHHNSDSVDHRIHDKISHSLLINKTIIIFAHQHFPLLHCSCERANARALPKYFSVSQNHLFCCGKHDRRSTAVCVCRPPPPPPPPPVLQLLSAFHHAACVGLAFLSLPRATDSGITPSMILNSNFCFPFFIFIFYTWQIIAQYTWSLFMVTKF